MTSPVTTYGQRRRQVLFVLAMGMFGMMFASLFVPQLPSYLRSMVVTDAERLYLVAQARPQPQQPREFYVTDSTDGSRFSKPTVCSGDVVGASAEDGGLVCVFRDGSAARLLKGPWTPIASDLPWNVLGIGTFDNGIWAFGQDVEGGKILTAMLDNDTWRPGVPLEFPGHEITYWEGFDVGGERLLLWLERPPEKGKIDYSLHLGRLGADRIERLPSLDLEMGFAFSPVVADGVLQVYWQKASSWAGVAPSLAGPIRRTTFREGEWTRATEVHGPRRRCLRNGDLAVATFKGRTLIYTFEYWYGILYRGLYGSEVRADELSEAFLVAPPSKGELEMSVYWVLLAVLVTSIAAGGLVGLVRLRHFERSSSPMVEQPVYATVTDRAAAAGLDLALVFMVLQYVMSSAALSDLWMTFLVVFPLYGAVLETAMGGQTLGKRLLGLRVLATTGSPVAFPAALRRNIFKFFEILTVGAAVCLVTRRFQRPGDLLAGTVVIKELHMLGRSGESRRRP